MFFQLSTFPQPSYNAGGQGGSVVQNGGSVEGECEEGVSSIVCFWVSEQCLANVFGYVRQGVRQREEVVNGVVDLLSQSARIGAVT